MTGGGVPIKVVRQRTSKTRLKMHWDYPVYVAQEELAIEESDSETVAVYARKALPREESFDWIAGEDPRPLLVLRECQWCNGTDWALLNASQDNEKTLLLAQWFHCVKLPNDVLEADHPFTSLFEDKTPPHLFVCSTDGSNIIPLRGDQSRTELWSAMSTILEQEYTKDAKKTVQEYMKLLADYDTIDSMEDWRQEQLDAAVEKHGPDSRQAKKIRKQLAELAKKKAKAMEREAELRDLGLKKKADQGQAVTQR
ncbi:MAG: hypothetical protein ISR76_08970 [Planctomycetes bacterium]|nr:hypothetical protein [Planctomycetota bacterium]MBL7009116.1 hypothetical protein [Planctomycetota bacterium]